MHAHAWPVDTVDAMSATCSQWKIDAFRDILCTCGHSMTCHNPSDGAADTADPLATALQQATFKLTNGCTKADSAVCSGRKKGEHPSNIELADRLLSKAELHQALEDAKCTCKAKVPCYRNLFTHDGTPHNTDLEGLEHIRWWPFQCA